jgi:hypothetical protein
MGLVPLFKMGDECPKVGCEKPITAIYFIYSLKLERYICEDNHHSVYYRTTDAPEEALSESYPFLKRDIFGKEQYKEYGEW